MSRRGLKIGGHLDRYVGSLFLSSYATAFLIVVGLFLILDMASNLDEYLEPWKNGEHAPSLLILEFYVLNIPFLFLQVAPFVTLVAGLFSVSKLLKHNETVAALAAGVSAHRVLAPIFLGGVLAGASMFGLREALSFKLANIRDEMKFILANKTYDRVYQELWLRDLNGSFVHLHEFRPSTGSPPVAEARGLQSMSMRSTTRWTKTEASRAVYVQKDGKAGWWLENGLKSESAEVQTQESIEMLEGFEFTPRLALTFWRAHENALELSFAETRELASRDPDNVKYQTLLQYHLTFPLANLVLLLVGLPILVRHERSKAAEGLARGCLLCIFYFAADFIARNLGLQGAIDPKLAAWLPVLLFGSLGLVLYDAMKT